MKISRFQDNLIYRIIKNIKDYYIWFFLVGIVTLISLFSDVFLQSSNIFNILRETVVVGIIAIGMTYVLIAHCFDLSAGAIMGLCAVISICLKPVNTMSTVLSVVIPILIGTFIGLVNGFLVGYLRLNGFIVTLGMQFLILGTTLLITGGNQVFIYKTTDAYFFLGNGKLFGIPFSIIVLILLCIIAQLVLSFTRFGQYLKLVGENEKSATLSGIKVPRVINQSYIFLGICAAISGIILASWVRQLDPGSGVGYEFSAITATILGGTSLLGGKGNVLNSFIGALIIVMITNTMMLFNIPYNYQLMVEGLILIIGAILGNYYGKKNK